MVRELLCSSLIYEKPLEVERKKTNQKKTNQSDSHFLTKNKSNSKRMATVASVYEIARFIRTPEDIMEEFFSTKE